MEPCVSGEWDVLLWIFVRHLFDGTKEAVVAYLLGLRSRCGGRFEFFAGSGKLRLLKRVSL